MIADPSELEGPPSEEAGAEAPEAGFEGEATTPDTTTPDEAAKDGLEDLLAASKQMRADAEKLLENSVLPPEFQKEAGTLLAAEDAKADQIVQGAQKEVDNLILGEKEGVDDVLTGKAVDADDVILDQPEGFDDVTTGESVDKDDVVLGEPEGFEESASEAPTVVLSESPTVALDEAPTAALDSEQPDYEVIGIRKLERQLKTELGNHSLALELGEKEKLVPIKKQINKLEDKINSGSFTEGLLNDKDLATAIKEQPAKIQIIKDKLDEVRDAYDVTLDKLQEELLKEKSVPLAADSSEEAAILIEETNKLPLNQEQTKLLQQKTELQNDLFVAEDLQKGLLREVDRRAGLAEPKEEQVAA